MAFQIKNFVSIAASMINRMKASTNLITDYNVGSIARTMIEAPAQELDELYQQMFNGLIEAIPTATYNTFSFTPLPAVNASQNITVDITSQATDTTIGAGTVFSFVGGQMTYLSAADVTIPAGSTTGQVLCVAASAGAAGNIPEGQSFTAAPTITGFVSATNANAFSNGTDLETEAQRLQRFGEYVATLARGTPAAIEYGAKTAQLVDNSGRITEKVVLSAVIEPYKTDNTQPVGLINLYVHNGVGGTSSQLVAQAAMVIAGYTDPNTGNKVPGYSAAGCHVVTAAAAEVSLNVSGAITAAPGYVLADLDDAAEAAISAYILSLDIGATFEFTESVSLVRAIPGVGNYVPASPTSDQTVTGSQKLIPGTIAMS